MILEVQHIEKNFGKYRALDDVSLNIAEGSVFGLLGPNGAGKTTLIRLINKIYEPDKGTILLDGHPLSDSDVTQIGYLPEERGLYKKMRVGEQALYLAQLKGLSRKETTRRLKQWFERLEIMEWWNRPVESLSKGMQQKVQFVVTVLHEPRLMIFDEPFSGFDPVNTAMLKREIMTLRDGGATIVLSTHNMSSVEELCDSIALINTSKVVLHGNVRDIRQSYRSNRYEVVVAGDGDITMPEGYRLLADKDLGNERQLHIAVPEGGDSGELLGALLPQCRVVSFREVLPTMNDIFIKTVTHTKS
ncbi:MAG: ATP-binding cassette domain-containing protein [Bacteroidales bacterium]|nr:ATP-binding cassette domain-containing protein [Bacteroidales bacterium]